MADGGVSPTVVRAGDLRKSYVTGRKQRVKAVDGVDFEIARGDLIAIIGPSGSGKSTLISLVAGLTRPDHGQLVVEDVDVARLRREQLARFRRQRVGVVFQAFNLLPNLTVEENVAFPLILIGIDSRERRERVARALARFHLSSRAQHRPSELSGGEQQRAAIARAIIHEPVLVLADEPTGNLDSTNTRIVCGLFEEIHSIGRTVIIATHDSSVASICARSLVMCDGRLGN